MGKLYDTANLGKEHLIWSCSGIYVHVVEISPRYIHGEILISDGLSYSMHF